MGQMIVNDEPSNLGVPAPKKGVSRVFLHLTPNLCRCTWGAWGDRTGMGDIHGELTW